MDRLERTLRQRLKMRLGSGLVRLLVATLGRSWRWDVAGAEDLEQSRPAEIVFWHEQGFPALVWIRRALVARRVPLVLLSSPSPDGDLSANVARAWNESVVRASSSRGGVEGLRALRRLVHSGGASPIVTPDGPRGPARTFAPGALQVARLVEIPVVPIGFSVRSSWRLQTWDRMIVPRPGTSIEVRCGSPRRIPRKLGDTELARTAVELGRELDRLSGLR